MARVPPETLLAEAAAPVLARVRSHREELCYPARRMLEHLEAHVFDVSLTVKGWWRACRVHNDSVRQQIQRLVGVTLTEYLRELRIETAMRLILLSEDLPLAEVGSLVGYERWEAFRAAFERLTFQRPTTYRERVREVRSRGAEMPDPIWVRREWLRKLERAQLPEGEMTRALDALEDALGIEPEPELPAEARASREGLGHWLAGAWEEVLESLPEAERRRQRVLGFHFETPALCEHLLRQSREEGRDDPPRGVAVATLALEQALHLRPRLGEPAATHLEARAWACLGNARRIAVDWAGAGEALDIAQELLAAHPAPPKVSAEWLCYKARLFSDQRQLLEALEISGRALESCPAQSSNLRAEILLGRGNILWHLSDLPAAAREFQSAFEVVKPKRDPYLACTALHNLATALCSQGQLRAAARWLARATPWVHKLGSQYAICQQQWLRGLIEARLGQLGSAAQCLEAARDRLLAIGRLNDAALAALDLGHLATRENRPGEVAHWVGIALPELARLAYDREGMAALRLLREALTADGRAHHTIIERFRSHAARLLGAPAVVPTELR